MLHKFKLKKNSKIKAKSLDVLDKRTAMWKPLLLILPALTVVILFIIIPFITAADDGFHSIPKGLHSHKQSDKIFSTHNFELVWGDDAFQSSLKNSMLYAIISIPLIMIISLIIASAISTLVRKKAKSFWQTIFFLPYVTSAIAIGLTFAYIFDFDKGVMNKMFGIKVPWLIDSDGNSAFSALLIYGVWKGLAFNILIFTTAMLGVNKNLYKSASIDGAGPIKQFFTITLPSIKSTTSFLFTMGLIGAIKVFPLALFQNNSQVAITNHGSTLLLYVYHQIVDLQNYGLAGAASLILVGISIGFTVGVKAGSRLIGYVARRLEGVNVQNKIMNSKSFK